MPFTIDEEKMKGGEHVQQLQSIDLAKPPVKSIPHAAFPKVLYKHPKEPFRVVIHRNANFEVVGEERIPSEHLTMRVSNADELKAALKDGWVKEPYVPQAAPDPNAHLYA